MRLIEEVTQDELERQIRVVKEKYDELQEEIGILSVLSDDVRELKNSGASLYDACTTDLWKELTYFVDDFLDIYYPVIDEEGEDFELAQQKYEDSKEAQNEARKRLLESSTVIEEGIEISSYQKDRERRLQTLHKNK